MILDGERRSDYFNGISYVTFQTKEMADYVVDTYGAKNGFFSEVFGKTTIRKMNLPGARTSNYTLKRAANPSDINWQNLGVSAFDVLKSRVITYSISLLLLVISFCILLGLKLIQKSMAKKLREDSTSTISAYSFRIISVGVAFVVMIVNSMLPMALRMLTLKEKHDSETSFFKSLTIKIAVVS